MPDDVTIRIGAEVSGAVKEILGLRADYLRFAADFEGANNKAYASVAKLFGDSIKRDAQNWVQTVQKLGGITKLTADENRQFTKVLDDVIAKYKALGEVVPAKIVGIRMELAKWAQGLADVKKATDAQAKAAADAAKSQQEQADQATNLLNRFFFRATGAIGLADLAARSLIKIFDTIVDLAKAAVVSIFELADAGSKLQNTQQAFRGLAAGIGESGDSMLKKSREATHGLISDFNLMATGNRAMLFGIKTSGDQFGMLGDAAIRLGRAMNIGPERAFDDLILAIGRVSPKIMDNLGIIVKVTEANANWAKSHDRTKESMRASDRVQAFYEESLRKIQKHLEEVGPLQLTFADRITQMSVRLENFIYGPGGLAEWISKSPVLNYALSQLSGVMNMAFGADKKAALNGIVYAIETLAIAVVDAAIIVVDFARNFNLQFGLVRTAVDFTGLAIYRVFGLLQRSIIDLVMQASLLPGVGGQFAKMLVPMLKGWDEFQKIGDSFKQDMVDTATTTAKLDIAFGASSAFLKQLEKNMVSLRNERKADTDATQDQIEVHRGLNQVDEEGLDVGKKKKSESELNRIELRKLSIDLADAVRNHVPLNEVIRDFGTRLATATDKAKVFGNTVPAALQAAAQAFRDLKFEEIAKKAENAFRTQQTAEFAAMASEAKAKVTQLGSNYKGLLELAETYSLEAEKVNKFGLDRQLADIDEKIAKERQKLGALPAIYRDAYEKAAQAIRDTFKTKVDDLEADRERELEGLRNMPGAYGEAYDLAVAAVNKEYDQKQEAFEAQLSKELAALGTIPGAYEIAYSRAKDAIDKQLKLLKNIALGTADTIQIRMDKLGIHTRAELQRTANEAVRDYEQMLASGLYTAATLQEAWLRAEEAKRKASGDTLAKLQTNLQKLMTIFTQMAQSSDGAFGRIAAGIAKVIGALVLGIEAGKQFKEQAHGMSLALEDFNAEGGHTAENMGNLAVAAVGLIGAAMGIVAAMDQATNGASRMGNAMRGALTGATIGGQIAGPWGALIGAGIGFLVGIFRKPEWSKVMDDVGKNWGVHISEALAKEIEALEKKLGVDRRMAELFSMDKIIEEAGGISGTNVIMFENKAKELLNIFIEGGPNAALAMRTLNTVIGEFATYSESIGGVISQSFEDIIAGAIAAGDTTVKVSELIDKVGGLNKDNIGSFQRLAADLMNTIIVGGPGAEKATADLDATMGKFADRIAKTGGIADQTFLNLIRQARAAGIELESVTKFLNDQMDKLAGGLNKAAKGFFGDQQIEALKKAVKDGLITQDEMIARSQEAFDRQSRLTLAAFNAEIANGRDAVAAMEALGEGLDLLIKRQEELGLTGGAAFDQLVRWRNLTKVNKELLESVNGINESMIAFYNLGVTDTDVYKDLQAQGASAYDRLLAAGFSENEALRQMKPFLETIIKLHKDKGIAIDEATQKMIDQANAQGILDAETMSSNDIMMTGFAAIIKALGGDIPEAFQKFLDKQKEVADKVAAGANDIAAAYKTNVVGGIDQVGIAIDGMRTKLDNVNWRNFAGDATGALDDVSEAVDRVSRGQSPGGLKEWSPMLLEAWNNIRHGSQSAIEDLGKLQKKVDQFGVGVPIGVNDVPGLVKTPAPGAEGAGAASKDDYNLTVVFKLLESADAADVWEKKMLPAAINTFGRGKGLRDFKQVLGIE